MSKQLDKMTKMLKLWLKKNELDGDLTFYEISDWKERNEDYHNDSELVITTEGGLYSMLNFGDSDEFYDLVESFGYYCELGHSWNLGFYPIGEELTMANDQSYSQKLKDIRWQKKRKYILERANYKCEDCGVNSNLDIHHCYYMYGFEPWEYPLDSLRCLCRKCHEVRGQMESILRGNLASLTTKEMQAILDLISTGIYWYPRETVFNFLSALKYDQEEMKALFNSILNSRRN